MDAHKLSAANRTKLALHFHATLRMLQLGRHLALDATAFTQIAVDLAPLAQIIFAR
jgi:hypothetical protein